LPLVPSPAPVLCSFSLQSPAFSTRTEKTILSCRLILFRVLLSLCLAPLLCSGAPLYGFRFLFSAIFTHQLRLPGFQLRVNLPRLRFHPAFAAILLVSHSSVYFTREALVRFTLQGFPLEHRLSCFHNPVAFLPLSRWPPRLSLTRLGRQKKFEPASRLCSSFESVLIAHSR
jgi:hypothetical protein